MQPAQNPQDGFLTLTCIYIYTYIYIWHTHTHIYIYIWHTHTHIYIYIHMTHTHIYIYIYIWHTHTYIYIFKHIYIYIHMHHDASCIPLSPKNGPARSWIPMCWRNTCHSETAYLPRCCGLSAVISKMHSSCVHSLQIGMIGMIGL